MIQRARLPSDLRVSRGSLEGDPSKTRPSFGRPLSPSFPVSNCVSEKAGNVRGAHGNRATERQGFVAQASFNADRFGHALPSLGRSPLRIPYTPLFIASLSASLRSHPWVHGSLCLVSRLQCLGLCGGAEESGQESVGEGPSAGPYTCECRALHMKTRVA